MDTGNQIDFPAVDVPKELLLEDFRQQCANLQGQYTRMHNRLQVFVGLNTALVPALGAVGLASSKGEVGRPWLILFPVAGILLSVVGFVTGATDRKLVTIYRDQLSWTAFNTLAVCKQPMDYPSWLHFGRDPGKVDEALDAWRPKLGIETKRSWWERWTEWRCKPLSVTRLPTLLSLLFTTLWIILLVLLLRNR
jgi:hypothetical protein